MATAIFEDIILGLFADSVSARTCEVVMSQETTTLLIKDLRNARRLFGPDWPKRIAAAQQLGALRAVDAVGDLAAVISEKKNADLSNTCVQALGQIGGPQSVQALTQVFDDPDQSPLHAQAIAALQQIGDETAVTALIAGWAQPDPARQQAITQALTQLGPDRILEPLLLACAGSTPQVSEQAGKMLRQLPDNTARLVAALGNPQPALRSSAVQLLAQIGSASVPALIMTLGQADQNARSAAVSALSKIGAPAVPELVKTLTGADATLSKAAGQALVSIGQPTARPLLELLPTQPPVADLLTQMKPEVKAVLDKTSTGDLPLVKAAFELSDADLRASAGHALARIGKPALSYLVEALHGDDDGMTQAAASALGQMGKPAVGELIKGLLSDNEETSRLAAGGLVDVGEPAVQALLDILGQPDEGDRRRARDLLQKIEAPEAVMLRPFLAHWNEMETCPRVLTIDPTGQGDFANLADAVAGTAPMSIISFAAGDHRLDSQLFITKPLALLGTGFTQTRLLCTVSLILIGGGLLSGGDEEEDDDYEDEEDDRPIVIHGLGIEYEGQTEKDVVRVQAHEAHLDKCRFAGGVAPRDKKSIGGHGLRLVGGTRCKVTRCVFEHNAEGAIGVNHIAEPLLEDNSCQGGRYAIAFGDTSAGIARRNHCTAKEGSGIVVDQAAEPELIENACEGNLVGIHYRERAAGIARRNQCKNNKWGIAVSSEAHPILESNLCSENLEFGISIHDQARPNVSSNVCQKNGNGGIFIYGSASGLIRENQCMDSFVGIALNDSA
ncbi:MAG: HEAT repeat domain-containing protein [Caldilinea sp.]